MTTQANQTKLIELMKILRNDFISSEEMTILLDNIEMNMLEEIERENSQYIKDLHDILVSHWNANNAEQNLAAINDKEKIGQIIDHLQNQ